MVVGGGGWWWWRGEGEEVGEFEGTCAADGEGFDDELAAEAEAFDVGGGFEREI